MRDKNRIKPILIELEKLWLQNPDFRIGQLILAITKTKESNPELFYMEDDEFLDRFQEFKKERKNKKENF